MPLWVAVWLFISRRIPWAALNARFVPLAAWPGAVGLGLVVLGLGFATWARVYLGRNWSAAVTLKRDHELVRSGPYRSVRNPIYTGILIALAGSARVVNRVNVGGSVAPCVAYSTRGRCFFTIGGGCAAWASRKTRLSTAVGTRE